MIRKLRLENYRSFEEYEFRDLARVNLLVGPNNCGKTSVLEAVELLASGGDPGVVLDSARRRGESYTAYAEDRRGTRYPLRHHFHGHRVSPGSHLRISSNDGLGQVEMIIQEAEVDETPTLFEVTTGGIQPLVLQIRRSPEETGKREKKDVVIPLMEDGSLRGPHTHLRRLTRASSGASVPIQFLTADSWDASDMAQAWDGVVVVGMESEVIEAMRILQPELGSIHFLVGDARRGIRGSAGIVLGFQPGTARVPIGSYGDGMRRLLALSLALAGTGGGFLLIDEIDTGLHWTVMEEMWKLVVGTAVRASIQVFATTHSLDCIQGLASLLRARPDLGDHVSIQKVERKLRHSASFGAQDILAAADLGVELR